MVTGEIRGEDRSYPEKVSFYRTNDAMLLGTEQDHSEPLMYDPRTGRFVYLTTVFAAYGMGRDQPEPGPYQTGSTQIRVEAPKFKPLVVQFFDEMPDVKIIVTVHGSVEQLSSIALVASKLKPSADASN